MHECGSGSAASFSRLVVRVEAKASPIEVALCLPPLFFTGFPLIRSPGRPLPSLRSALLLSGRPLLSASQKAAIGRPPTSLFWRQPPSATSPARGQSSLERLPLPVARGFSPEPFAQHEQARAGPVAVQLWQHEPPRPPNGCVGPLLTCRPLLPALGSSASLTCSPIPACADRSKVTRRDHEPTGEAESLAGRISTKEMGTRLHRSCLLSSLVPCGY